MREGEREGIERVRIDPSATTRAFVEIGLTREHKNSVAAVCLEKNILFSKGTLL